jgi:hypothetical protein
MRGLFRRHPVVRVNVTVPVVAARREIGCRRLENDDLAIAGDRRIEAVVLSLVAIRPDRNTGCCTGRKIVHEDLIEAIVAFVPREVVAEESKAINVPSAEIEEASLSRLASWPLELTETHLVVPLVRSRT